MARRACAVLAIALGACGNAHEPSPLPGRASGSGGSAGPGAAGSAGPRTTGSAAGGCEPLPFAVSSPVPEASGAAWFTLDGRRVLVIVGDSGNHGAYGVVDPDTGATTETGRLPLGDGAHGAVNDDIEGLAARGDRLYGLTSSGWIRVWQRSGAGFALVDGPYALGPIDLPDRKSNDRPPDGDGMVCGGGTVNCGRNYEGLCLAPAPGSGACAGFAAAKADGHLYCVTEQAGRLAVHHDRAIEVTRPGALADCAFSDDGALWAGSNLFDLGRVYRVTGWDDPAHARAELVGALPIGFPEVVAARGDVVYRMSDMGGAPSLMARFRCPR